MNKNLTCGPMLVIGAGSIGIFLWGGSFSSLHRSMHQSFPKTPSIAGPGSEWKNRHEIVPTYRTKWIKLKTSTNSKGQTKIVSNRFLPSLRSESAWGSQKYKSIKLFLFFLFFFSIRNMIIYYENCPIPYMGESCRAALHSTVQPGFASMNLNSLVSIAVVGDWRRRM